MGIHINYHKDTEKGIDAKLNESLLLQEGDQIKVVGIPLSKAVKENHPIVNQERGLDNIDFHVSTILPVSYVKLLKRPEESSQYKESIFNSVWKECLEKEWEFYAIPKLKALYENF